VRVRSESLFQSAEALRKRVEELEQVVAEMHGALRMANDNNLYLAKRVKELEDRLGALKPQD
jgi:predicted nuclease with TOPRIM domain